MLCPGFEVEIFTKFLHRGGVTGGYIIIINLILLVQIADDGNGIRETAPGDDSNEVETVKYFL